MARFVCLRDARRKHGLNLGSFEQQKKKKPVPIAKDARLRGRATAQATVSSMGGSHQVPADYAAKTVKAQMRVPGPY